MASTLTGSSTDAEVWAAYDDNASYEEDASRTKALAFLTACRILLRRTPARSSRGTGSSSHLIEFDPARLTAEMTAARVWLVRNPSTSQIRTRFADLQDFRDDTSGGSDD